jgi:HK97 family phage major capsid protein
MPHGAKTESFKMATSLMDLRRQRDYAMNKADSIVGAAERANRELTETESTEVETCMAAVKTLNPQIKSLEKKNTIFDMVGPMGAVLIDGGRKFTKQRQVTLSEQYPDAFYTYIQSGGKQMDAALYEGSESAGGYAVPIVVDDQIVPLAPTELAVRQLASVIPTVSDVKVPTKTSFSQAATKAELSAFASTAPTIGQFTLSAFMIGQQNDISFELVQDVPVFQSFLVQDMLLAQQMLEETKYVLGSGVNEPQGLIGNVGAGVTEEPDSNGNLVSISGTLDLIGKVNAAYLPNASWLMSRPTSIIIRKAQVGANLFNPAWTRVGSQDFLHGFPVAYSGDMPTAARGACPVLFGDFKRGYLIGDRGGSGINVKVLDQPKAAQGIITLLTYRRTDGRVRLAEAIQSYNIAAS